MGDPTNEALLAIVAAQESTNALLQAIKESLEVANTRMKSTTIVDESGTYVAIDEFPADVDPTTAEDGDLIALANVTGTGFPARIAEDTWTTRTIAVSAVGLTITDAAGVAGNPTIALTARMQGLEAMPGPGLAVLKSDGTYLARTLFVSGGGLQLTNGNGDAGNPTLALANDVAAVEALATSGFAVRTAADTWATREILGTANQVTVTNGTGVAGDVTLSLPQSIHTGAKPSFAGVTLTASADIANNNPIRQADAGGTLRSLLGINQHNITRLGPGDNAVAGVSGGIPFIRVNISASGNEWLLSDYISAQSLIFVIPDPNLHACLIAYIGGSNGSVTKLADPFGVWNIVQGAANHSLYYSGGKYRLRNNTASTVNYTVYALEGRAV